MGLDDKNRPLYMISIAAELAGVHPQTLRSYEQKGLVTPRRTSGNTRMSSEADIDRLNLINELTSEGINLAGVTRILDLQSRLDEREEEVEDLRGLVKQADRTAIHATAELYNVTPEQLAEIMRSMFGDRLVPELPKDVTSASAKSDTPVPLPDEEVMDDDDDA